MRCTTVQRTQNKKKDSKNKTYDTKKQCPGMINLQNKTHEESTIKHTIIMRIGEQLAAAKV